MILKWKNGPESGEDDDVSFIVDSGETRKPCKKAITKQVKKSIGNKRKSLVWAKDWIVCAKGSLS